MCRFVQIESVSMIDDLEEIAQKPTKELKKELLKLKGVGPKVADCIALFGFYRTDSFPVDTWIEKLYHENFNGKEKDRAKRTNPSGFGRKHSNGDRICGKYFGCT